MYSQCKGKTQGGVEAKSDMTALTVIKVTQTTWWTQKVLPYSREGPVWACTRVGEIKKAQWGEAC